ncbi:Ribokinase-like protein [Gorgonomyces haynaldii]|nr:Ribokinase-like protein [Gorgonomyces haynaldii]
MSYLLLGIENPLLDISSVVKPELLAKYNLKSNDAILADEAHKGVFEDLVRDYKVMYIAGGAAQNTCRGAQWLLPKNSTVYLGCVGKDENAEILRQAAKKDGLNTLYLEDPELPTGKCAVLITGTHRSMVTDLLAANAYKIEHLERPEVWATVEASKNFYIGGYFLTVSPPSAMKIAKHAAATGKNLTMNLSAPFIPQFFKEPLNELIHYADVVFGNEAEALAWAQANGHAETDVPSIALKIAALPKATSKPRLVVLTQGAHPTCVAFEGKTTLFPIIPIAVEKIKDTNGAGDAFCGGFLSQFVQGASVPQSVAAGHYVAHVVIQRDGPSYPSEPHGFKFEQ